MPPAAESDTTSSKCSHRNCFVSYNNCCGSSCSSSKGRYRWPHIHKSHLLHQQQLQWLWKLLPLLQQSQRLLVAKSNTASALSAAGITFAAASATTTGKSETAGADVRNRICFSYHHGGSNCHYCSGFGSRLHTASILSSAALKRLPRQQPLQQQSQIPLAERSDQSASVAATTMVAATAALAAKLAAAVS